MAEDDSDVKDEKNAISTLTDDQIKNDDNNMVVLQHLKKEYLFSLLSFPLVIISFLIIIIVIIGHY